MAAEGYWGAFGTGSPGEEATRPPSLWDKLFGGAVNSLATLPKRAIEGAAMYQPGSGEIPNETIAPALEAATLPMGTGALAGVPVKAGEAVLGAGPIRAYHGSPYDFDRFDLSKIGTGEGAQAYGHGLYFAESPKVAEIYRNKLGGQDVNSTARFYLEQNNWDKPAAIAQMEAEHAKMPEFGKNVVDNIRGQIEKSPARMYEVNINADPAHFLDWDKSLSQQSPPAIQKLDQTGFLSELKSINALQDPRTNVRDLVNSLQRGYGENSPVRSEPEATAMLSNAGIPGIKYLDQGSRLIPQQVEHLQNQVSGLQELLSKTPSGDQKYASIESALRGRQNELSNLRPSSNYVVWNDKIIDIMRKFGLLGAMAPPAAAMGYSNLMDQRQ